MLCRGRIENQVGRRYIQRIANIRERPGIFVQVEIDEAHLSDIVFGPTAGAIFQRIHADEHYVELEGVFIGLELVPHEQSLLRAD